MSRILLFVALLVCSLSFLSGASLIGYSDSLCTTVADGFDIGGFSTNTTCTQRTISDTNLAYSIVCTDNLAGSTISVWSSDATPVSCDSAPLYAYTGTFDGTTCIVAEPAFFGQAHSLKINCNSAAGLTVLSSLLVALVALVTKATQWF